MYLDYSLCRRILLATEAHPEPFDVPLSTEGDENALHYCAEKLMEAGLIHAQRQPGDDLLRYRVHRLTAQGHDLVALCRDEMAWQHAISSLEGKGAPVNWPALTRLMSEYLDFRMTD